MKKNTKEDIVIIAYIIICILLIGLKYIGIITACWFLVLLPSIPVAMILITLITIELFI